MKVTYYIRYLSSSKVRFFARPSLLLISVVRLPSDVMTVPKYLNLLPWLSIFPSISISHFGMTFFFDITSFCFFYIQTKFQYFTTDKI